MTVSKREVRAARQLYWDLAEQYLRENGWQETDTPASVKQISSSEAWVHPEESPQLPHSFEMALGIQYAREGEGE